MARSTGLSPEFVRELMQAMGRPSPRPRQRVFADDDIEVARVFRRFLDAGLPRHELLEVSRVLSQGMANTAEAVRRVVGNAMLQPGDSEDTLALRLFVSPTVRPLVETGTSMVQRVHDEGPEFPDVRVGLALGVATPRGGDWFGRPVNLANRVTDVAKPGTVLATEAIHDQTPELAWKRKRHRRLKGIDGRVRLFSLG